MDFPTVFKNKTGIPVEPFSIDWRDFETFTHDLYPYIQHRKRLLQSLPIKARWPFDPPPTLEKQLEYFISLKLLQLSSNSRYIDIASCMSLFPFYVKDVFGCEVYRQDMFYKTIPDRYIIGGDASSMPFPERHFTHMTLHCSLEHFEGEADKCFMKEVARVISPGGSVCILPFYCGEEGDVIHRDIAWKGSQFIRTYSPEAFRERILELNLPLTFHFVYTTNLNEVIEGLYCQFALLIHPLGTWGGQTLP
jgi:SAM-dependent methyltransferase